jgi:murein L,D-transpeptidase YcbB/YkuD
MFKELQTIIVITFFWAAASFASQMPADVAMLDQKTSEHIETLLESRSALSEHLTSVSRLLSHGQIFELYQQREFLPIWIDGWQLKPEALLFLEYLRNAGSHGLCGNDYLLTELEDLILIQMYFARHNMPLASENRAVLDLFLSQAFLTFTTYMVEGQVDPALAHVDWSARRRKADLVKLLEYAVGEHRVQQVLEGLIPPHKEYRQLVAALSHYQKISAFGGWPVIPSGPTIRPGDEDERVPLLRTLLQITGDLEMNSVTTLDYDSVTSDALRHFQLRHGLVEDGVIGIKTLAVLNVSVEERIRQIELNLERWRWMPKSFGERHIRVNIAAFLLDVVEDDEIVMQMPVIVGTQYRKTPVFSAQMTYLEFAPYWNVPPTILREDKLPKIKKNPDYLAEKNFRIISRIDDNRTIDPRDINWKTVEAASFPGLLRMEPGPWNPLGRVKFMFPNKFNVYLHDTNEAALFGENVRSFSSGCIRVKRPYDLAQFLLGKNFDQKRLQAFFVATTPEQVLIKALPVHIQYWTAWVSQDNLIHFRPDVYYRDLDLDIALKEPAYRVLDQLKVSIGMRLAKY